MMSKMINPEYIRLEDRPAALLLELPGHELFSPKAIRLAINNFLNTLDYQSRQSFEAHRTKYYQAKLGDIDRSLPDDEKSLKQRRKEERADAEGYVAEDASILEEYDFLLSFEEDIDRERAQNEQEKEELLLKRKSNPIRAAFAYYMQCVSKLEVRLMLILMQQADAMVNLVKNLCPELDGESLAQVRKAMLYGQDPFKMVPELKRRIPEIEEQYTRILSTLRLKGSLLPSYSRHHFDLHMAPAMALSLAIAKKPYTEQLFTNYIRPIVDASVKQLSALQMQVEQECRSHIAHGLFGAVSPSVRNPFNPLQKPLG